MAYSQDFIDRVKKVFPGWENMHNDLDKGDAFVGQYLSDSRGAGLSPVEVVKMIEEGKIKEIKVKAQRLIEIDFLYSEWQKQQAQILKNRNTR